jgi:hypothetical protein
MAASPYEEAAPCGRIVETILESRRDGGSLSKRQVDAITLVIFTLA